jgi:3-dehydroquinate dehydratase/shikimate dehydrogenase
MICVTLAQENRALLLADLLNAAALGADLVEVRLDCLDKAPNFAEMLAARRVPVLFSCRRPRDGGRWQGSEEERLMLLRQAIMSKADYVELEYDVAEQVRPFPGCKRVISYTNPEKMPSAIGDIYDDMLTLQPDVVKLTVRARTPEEAWPLVQILGRPKVPTVVVGLGRAGATLTVLGKRIGSPWTGAALERGMEAFPGQPTVRDLVEVYRYRDLGKGTRLVGVTGLGEREFLTAGLLNAAFAHLGLPHRCLPLQMGDLKLFRKVIDAVKLQGVAVDDSAYERLHEAAFFDETARPPTQAADLLLPDAAHGWVAANTLGRWATAALEESLRKHDPTKAEPLKGRVVMLAGVGAPTRMIAAALKSRGAALVFASKDRAAAQRASAAFGGRFVAWEGIYTTLHDVLLVGGDPAQDEGEVAGDEELPIHPGYLKSNVTVLDLTTLPRRSRFAREAALRGANVVAPGEVLIEQAREHARRVVGQEVPAEVLREKLTAWLDDEE